MSPYYKAIWGGVFTITLISVFILLAVIALLSFSIEPHSNVFYDSYTIKILKFTVFQAVLSTLLSIALAVPFVLALARYPNFIGRIWIVRLMSIPMGLPVIVGVLGILSIWGRHGFINNVLQFVGLDQPVNIYGLGGILIAHVFFNMPLATRLLLAGLESVPGEYWRNTAVLGMSRLSIFRLVEWPAISRLLPATATLIFMLCITSFTIVLLLGGGPASTTIEVAIYQALRFDFDPERAISLALLQIALTAMLLTVMKFISAEVRDSSHSFNVNRRYDDNKLSDNLLDWVIIFIGVGFILMPLLAIVISGISTDITKLLTQSAFWMAFKTSMIIGLISASFSVIFSLFIIHSRLSILENRRASRGAMLLASLLAYASTFVLLVPPVVLGSGWFVILIGTGDVSAYGPYLVVIINMIMSLPFVIGVLEPAIRTYRFQTGRLSLSLGLGGLAYIRLVAIPALRRPLAMAFSFAMALSLGDLGAIALFGSEDFKTLPWLIYSSMGSYRTDDAAGYALILGVICFVLAAYGAVDQAHSKTRT